MYVHCNGKLSYLQEKATLVVLWRWVQFIYLKMDSAVNLSVPQVASWLDCPLVFHPAILYVADLREWPFLVSLLPTLAPRRHFLLCGHRSCWLKQHHLRLDLHLRLPSLPPSSLRENWWPLDLLGTREREKTLCTLVRHGAEPLLFQRKLSL